MPRAARDKVTGLTEKMLAFCRVYFENGGKSADAYAVAYEPEKSSPTTIRRKAHDVLHDPAVQAQLAKMREDLQEKVVIGKAAHLAELVLLRTASVEEGDFRAAVKAEELRGRALGFYVEKVAVGDANSFANMTDDELNRRRKEIEEEEAAAARAEASVRKAAKKKPERRAS